MFGRIMQMSSSVGAVCLLCAAISLHGCGGGGSGGSTPAPTPTSPTSPPSPPSPKPTALPTVPTPPPTVLPPTPPPPSLATGYLRGMCYGSLPCPTHEDCDPLPGQDMMQSGYGMQWGPQGRDDLLTMRMLGANTVRMYHSIGSKSGTSHSPFLEHAAALSLNLWPGLDSDNIECDENHDCYTAYKDAVKTGFSQGFSEGGEWHRAVQTVILMNEPDFITCEMSDKNMCRGMAAISAMEGFLDAEEEMNVAGTVNLTITWSFAARDSIDGKVTNGPGYFGFQDMLAITSNPSLVGYTPRGSVARLTDAYNQRWIHGVNIQGPFDYTYNMISKVYEPYNAHPWIIGEYGGNGETDDQIQMYLSEIESHAKDPTNLFAGSSFFQFQTAYQKSGSELNFGVFSLGNQLVGRTGEVCGHGGCRDSLPVMCLSSTLPTDPGTLNHRAEAVASAWGGQVFSVKMCTDTKSKASNVTVV